MFGIKTKKSKTVGLTEFGKILSKLRVDANEDLTAQGKRLNVSSTLISLIMHGKREVTDRFFFRVICSYKTNGLIFEYLEDMLSIIYKDEFERLSKTLCEFLPQEKIVSTFIKIKFGDSFEK